MRAELRDMERRRCTFTTCVAGLRGVVRSERKGARGSLSALHRRRARRARPSPSTTTGGCSSARGRPRSSARGADSVARRAGPPGLAAVAGLLRRRPRGVSPTGPRPRRRRRRGRRPDWRRRRRVGAAERARARRRAEAADAAAAAAGRRRRRDEGPQRLARAAAPPRSNLDAPGRRG